MQNVFAGWHLTYDGIVHPQAADRLGDVAFLERNFLDLVSLLDMEVLVPPVFKVVPLNPEQMKDDTADEGGVTGTCIITTSHLSIHTWPLRHRFSLDAFSCKNFSKERAIGFLSDRFLVKRSTTHWIERTWP